MAEEQAKTVTAPVNLPRVAITYCTQCRWMLRAAYVSHACTCTTSRSGKLPDSVVKFKLNKKANEGKIVLFGQWFADVGVVWARAALHIRHADR